MEKILIQIRRQLGWSQTEMASVLGVSRSQYAMAETGKSSLNPNAILFVLKLNEKIEQGQKLNLSKSVSKEVFFSQLENAELEIKEAFYQLKKQVQNQKFKKPLTRITILHQAEDWVHLPQSQQEALEKYLSQSKYLSMESKSQFLSNLKWKEQQVKAHAWG